MAYEQTSHWQAEGIRDVREISIFTMTCLAIFSLFLAILATLTSLIKRPIFLYCLGTLLTPVWPIVFGFGCMLVAFSVFSGAQMKKFCEFTLSETEFEIGIDCWLNDN